MSTPLEMIKTVLHGVQLATVSTVTADGGPQSRYVMIRVDDDMTMRFASHLRTAKIEQIRANDKVYLLCGVASLETARHWVEVKGRAEVRTDDEARRAMWIEPLGRYFRGPDDPNLAVVVVKPASISYHGMGQPAPVVWTP